MEAGEKLGFLPGDLQSKVDPYLRPLYDALFDFLGQEQFSRNLEKGVIEVAPIAYMRGRTLNDAFIILDEGQNATLETLKMVLTRFGEGSHLVLTGDITQIDLSGGQKSGLKQCAQMLRGIDDIGVIQLTNRDVVRHKLVKEIIKAFEKYEKTSRSARQPQTLTLCPISSAAPCGGFLLPANRLCPGNISAQNPGFILPPIPAKTARFKLLCGHSVAGPLYTKTAAL